MTSSRRGLRVILIPLLLAVSLGACSNSEPVSNPTPGAASPSADAQALLTDAAAKTRALESYAFEAEFTLGSGPGAETTEIEGSVVSPDASRYVTTAGESRIEVVRIGSTSYERIDTQPWRKVAETAPSAAPATELANVISQISQARLAGASGEGTQLEGLLSAAAVKQLLGGESGGGSAVPARITLDEENRVTELAISLQVSREGKVSDLEAVTRFSGFNAQPPITAPV